MSMSVKVPIDHNNRSLLFGRLCKDASAIRDSVSSGNDVFQDVPGLDLRTIKNIIGGKVIKANIVTSVQRMASLNYLSSFLDLRGRLQELGAIFSPSSELVAYGDPASHREFEEMLALGPMYEEQWNMFFVEYRTAELQDTADMWPDLRTLKKILASNGIIFGVEHLRLNCGDSSDSMLRLCKAYDELRKQWLAMMQIRLPGGDDEELRDPEKSCSGDGPGFGDNSDSTPDDAKLDRNADSNPNSCTDRARSSGVPQNLGWRFSDDIEVLSKGLEWDFRDSKEADTMDQPELLLEVNSRYLTADGVFESQLRFAAGITLPISRPGTPGHFAQNLPRFQASGLDQMHPSPSSSQEFENPSMTLLEALAMIPPGYDSLKKSSTPVDDAEKPIAFYRMEQKQETKKWGLWTWLRRALGQNE